MLYGHELEEMQMFLPEIEAELTDLKTASGRPLWEAFRNICEEWSVYTRYSAAQAKVDQARRYLDTVNEVRKWLKEL